MYFLAFIFGGVLLLYLALSKKEKKVDYMQEFNQTLFIDSMDNDQQAINLKSLSDQSLKQKIEQIWGNVNRQLGKLAFVKVIVFVMAVALLAVKVNEQFFRVSITYVIIVMEVLAIIFGYLWLKKREKSQFEESFPDALNMLASAVSAGESIMHAIIFVGKSLEGEVGKEFKVMGERLQLGDTPDSVFRKSCHRFPYASFHFFVITLRANMQRGGQLKEVMSRLNRLMFDARAIEKKKYALTSEARTSAKIVGSIPFFFLFMLQYLSPENYEFIMFHPDGRSILYYVLVSEFIGISIVWSLMKGVK
ncbi:type II secretion system F family protein [Aliivibrio wodanis]|uniref:Bacterial type II secretion system protein F n=1 Tax=Aliivibrio wodanis TaxID=80852 RepID=A0A090K1C3_9GAMM|nr:bacterial type II secretion system protein F [Aliivibrio wodanis]VVV05868.1 hypothetical protein AW0309160_03351 [Aliivibrio wodanis]